MMTVCICATCVCHACAMCLSAGTKQRLARLFGYCGAMAAARRLPTAYTQPMAGGHRKQPHPHHGARLLPVLSLVR